VRRALLVAVTLALAVSACSDDGEELPSDTRAPIASEPSVPTTAPPPVASVPLGSVTSLDGVEVGLEEVAQLEEPIVMATRPGEPDRVYVGERAGRVLDLSLTDGSSDVVLDISDQTTIDSERGLLGLAVSPDGAFLYVSHTNDDGDSRVDEYAVDEDGSLDEASRRIVFALDQPFPNHNGGNIVFGPDGFLYLGFGDGGSAGDPLLAGQDRGVLLGSILRIDPRQAEDGAYTVPADNPYVGQEGARPEVWLKGVRNPWRLSFDLATGDLWIGDVGQNEVEEVDWLPAGDDGAGRGANLGWNEMEGDVPFEDGTEPDDHTPPVFTYTHSGDGGCSITGGFVYRGLELPDLHGAYLYSDYCLGELRALAFDRDAGEVVDDATILPDPLDAPISFGQDADGELYVLTQAGRLSRIVPVEVSD
jgi:glucose/arabinose dehydrogenase